MKSAELIVEQALEYKKQKDVNNELVIVAPSMPLKLKYDLRICDIIVKN